MVQPQQNPETPQEESVFNEADFSMKGYDKHIRTARIILFIIAGLQLIAIFLLPDMPEEARMISIGVYVFFAAVFAGLAIWSKYKPFAALLTALIVYLAIYVVSGIIDPSYFIKGILIKIVIVIMLILGVRNAKEGEDLKKTFGK